MEKIRLRELQDLKGLLDSNMHLTEAQEQRFCDLAFDYHVEQLMKGDGHDYSKDFLREKKKEEQRRLKNSF